MPVMIQNEAFDASGHKELELLGLLKLAAMVPPSCGAGSLLCSFNPIAQRQNLGGVNLGEKGPRNTELPPALGGDTA